MRRRHLFPFAALACALFVIAMPNDADAGVLLGADAGIAMPLGDWTIKPGGVGFDTRLRLGYELPVPVIRVVPEILGGYATFPKDEAGNAAQSGLSGRAGARVGIGGIIGPMLYAHVGYTHLYGAASDYTVRTSGLSYDAGLALDFTLLPLLNVGVHGGYNAVRDEDKSAQWVDVGAHVELNF